MTRTKLLPPGVAESNSGDESSDLDGVLFSGEGCGTGGRSLPSLASPPAGGLCSWDSRTQAATALRVAWKGSSEAEHRVIDHESKALRSEVRFLPLPLLSVDFRELVG